MLNHFSDDQILQAKTDLWNFCGKQLGELPKRRTTQSKTETEAHLLDISAVKHLDRKDKLPVTVINTFSLGMIPRSHPKERNNISLCDRLNRLEL